MFEQSRCSHIMSQMCETHEDSRLRVNVLFLRGLICSKNVLGAISPASSFSVANDFILINMPVRYGSTLVMLRSNNIHDIQEIPTKDKLS